MKTTPTTTPTINPTRIDGSVESLISGADAGSVEDVDNEADLPPSYTLMPFGLLVFFDEPQGNSTYSMSEMTTEELNGLWRRVPCILM